MKQAVLIFIIGWIPLSLHSQEIKDDIIVKTNRKGEIIKYTVSDWGLQLSAGATKYFYDKKTKKYFGNHWGPDFKLTFYHKNFYLGFDFRPATVNPKDTLYFNTGELFHEADLNIIKTDVTIGYTINLPMNFSVEPYMGYLSTSFPIINEEEITDKFYFEPTKGFTVGFTLNKYIELKNLGEYFVIYLNNNLNYSNYSKMHFFLGDSFYALEIGFGYKGWFSKKIR